MTNFGDPQFWEERFGNCNAVWIYPGHGPHALYTLSDKHSDYYFNTNEIVKHPTLLNTICENVFLPAISKQDLSVDWVLSYPPFGVPVAYALAQTLSARFAYTRSAKEAEIDFPLRPSDSVLLVADDLYTGGSLRRALAGALAREAKVFPLICMLGNFSGASSIEGISIASVVEKQINLWSPDECPICRSGSQPILARSNWRELTGR